MAVTDWWSTLDPYQFPLDEAAVFYRTIYQTLIRYDERTHKFVPRLANAWKRLDDDEAYAGFDQNSRHTANLLWVVEERSKFRNRLG